MTNGDVIMAMFPTVDTYFSNVIDMKLWWNAKYKGTGKIHCTCNEDIAKAFQFGLAFGFGKKYDEMDRVIDEIKKVITPQPKIGKWILSGGYWRCSECKEKALLKLDKAKGNCKEYMPIRSDFCPKCGAKMESEE